MAIHVEQNGNLNADTGVSRQTVKNSERNLRLAQQAVREAQDENRRLGIPNWWMINGKIVSDQQIAELDDAREIRDRK